MKRRIRFNSFVFFIFFSTFFFSKQNLSLEPQSKDENGNASAKVLKQKVKGILTRGNESLLEGEVQEEPQTVYQYTPEVAATATPAAAVTPPPAATKQVSRKKIFRGWRT